MHLTTVIIPFKLHVTHLSKRIYFKCTLFLFNSAEYILMYFLTKQLLSKCRNNYNKNSSKDAIAIVSSWFDKHEWITHTHLWKHQKQYCILLEQQNCCKKEQQRSWSHRSSKRGCWWRGSSPTVCQSRSPQRAGRPCCSPR